ncbi:uncharacterized protein F4822DRAFT_442070 [Hypoxylon trugodes]|uniref:uncharacterized protein n=1 Tax=Hypoxylon trugodes TaxID=326681 RepID=UPI002192083A|nr:uncharacterized protein F4822DRAFT_442070 [Hypoxylon trugodes]KAI1390820.1 hypothetical protein F4822DRAFT_442070 [Hypoxylon trugodes]
MKFSALFTLASWSSLVLGYEYQYRTPVPWTLFNTNITCDTSCQYNFTIHKHDTDEVFHCSFVEPNLNSEPVYADRPCLSTTPRSVTTHWGSDRSIVLLFMDYVENINAFYSLFNWEVRDGIIVPNKTRWAVDARSPSAPFIPTELPFTMPQ